MRYYPTPEENAALGDMREFEDSGDESGAQQVYTQAVDPDGRCLALQFHAVGQVVALGVPNVVFEHGVDVSGSTFTAAVKTVHGEPEKPMVVLEGALSVVVLKKEREMRFGALDLPSYRALHTVQPGQSWSSEKCTGLATYLCCYAGGTAHLNSGNQHIKKLDLRVEAGDTVGAGWSDIHNEVRFFVNGTHVASAPAPGGQPAFFGVQFHTEGDAVELAPAPAGGPAAAAVADLPRVVNADIPRVVTLDELAADGFLLRPIARGEPEFEMLARAFTVTKPDELNWGKDVAGFVKYDGLVVAGAWQVLSLANYRYCLARKVLKNKNRSAAGPHSAPDPPRRSTPPPRTSNSTHTSMRSCCCTAPSRRRCSRSWRTA